MEGNFLINKKTIILAIFLVNLLTISVVSATENITTDIISVDNTIEVNSLSDDNVNIESADVKDTSSQDILKINESQDTILLKNEERLVDSLVDVKDTSSQDILETSELQDTILANTDYNSFLTSSSHLSVKVKDSTMVYGLSGVISMSVSSSVPDSYSYYMNVYDSNNILWISELITGDIKYATSETYTISPDQIKHQGAYTIKIIDNYYSEVVGTGTLIVEPPTLPPSSEYSVRVSNEVITYGSSGRVSIDVDGASGYSYTYYYIMEICDSNNDTKISKSFSSTSATGSLHYETIDTNLLSPGTYNIRIINYKNVMNTATLLVQSASFPSSSSYSVDVADSTIDYNSDGKINMTIIPASSTTYKYYYYLKIYDSDNNEKISNTYYSTKNNNFESYTLYSTKLAVGNYTVKITNRADNNVMSTSKLTIASSTYPSSSDYSVIVSNSTMGYGATGIINMNISSIATSNYKYYYYLAVYGPNNNEEFHKLYSGTLDNDFRTYTINANQLCVGNYTVRIIDYTSKKILNTAKLTVNPTSYPSASDYSVNIYYPTIKQGVEGFINMSITPASDSFTYKYYYYLKVYHIDGTEKLSQLYMGTTEDYSKIYTVEANKLDVGIYNAKIINYLDNTVMNTVQFRVISPENPSYLDYSVKVSDIVINDTSSASIKMCITPSSSSNYTYFYTLQVYDSNNNQIVYQLYYGKDKVNSKTYTIDKVKLSHGVYTIKIYNYEDGKLMDNATLTIKSAVCPYSSDYLVNVSDTNLEYLSSGYIRMSIVPASNLTYKYYYYLKVYDSNNTEVISEFYSGKDDAYYKSYYISGNQLSLGTYTIKIVNYIDNSILSTATLTIKNSTPIYPPSSDYSVSVSDLSMDYGSSGVINMNISPANCIYKYYYYLKVYDSNNNENISKLYYSNTNATSKTYTMSENQLNPGTYTIKIINYADNEVMSTATLTVEYTIYPFSSDYSVTVSNSTIDYGYSGNIKMTITPTSNCKYPYYYYLKVYDSNNNENISKLYYSTTNATSKTYTMGANQLNPGTYTIKIINYADNEVMSTATLRIGYFPYPSASDYSVSIYNSTIDYRSSGSINMYIYESSRFTYKYAYYLKVYDSNNNEKISELYSDTISAYSKNYNINSKELNPGTYTIKIINYADNEVMNSATLIVTPSEYPYSSDYSVSVSDLSMDYGSSGIISMNIAPASSSIYKYYYYLKVYDSNNNEKVSELYYSNRTDYSNTYSISANQLNPGTYTLKIINLAEYDVMSTATLTVKSPIIIPTNPDNPEIVSKEPTRVFAKNNNVVYGNNLDFVLDTYKSGLVVSVKINGITKNYVTSNGGHIYIPTTGLGAGSYSATIIFNGNNLYEKSTSVIKVTVKKATPKITAKSKTFKKSVKTKKYGITLKDNNGKVMKDTKVTIKVNKKSYSAKTNSKGIATFKITKLTKKGSFTSVITYKGSKYYNKVTKKAKIKIK